MWERVVGKGDRRTRRGKIYAGSFGKSRPKSPDAKAKPAGGAAEKAAAPAAKPAAAKAPARKKSG
jgi:30S ribosomal protein S31